MTNIKKRRFELGLTQYDVEKLVGISQGRLSLIENGYRKPAPHEKKILATVLKTSTKELFPASQIQSA